MSHDHKRPAHNNERHNDERSRSGGGSHRDRSQPLTLRDRRSQDLQLRGMAERTQQGYLREVRKLAVYYNTRPDRLSEQQVADHLLYLINDCEFAPGSLRVACSGLMFFFTFTCPRERKVLTTLRIPKQKTLPDVLSIDEVHRLIATVRQPRGRKVGQDLHDGQDELHCAIRIGVGTG